MTRVELLKVLVEDYNEDISTIKSLTKEELEELLEEYIDAVSYTHLDVYKRQLLWR